MFRDHRPPRMCEMRYFLGANAHPDELYIIHLFSPPVRPPCIERTHGLLVFGHIGYTFNRPHSASSNQSLQLFPGRNRHHIPHPRVLDVTLLDYPETH